jgi:hypothetical protein
VSEAKTLRDILLKVGGKKHVRLFRNNVGFAQTSTGSFIKFGLCPGSSDLIGITKVKITKDMVGQEIGVFTAIEVKDKKGRLSKIQQNFIRVIKLFGGIAGVAKSVEEAEELTEAFKP